MVVLSSHMLIYGEGVEVKHPCWVITKYKQKCTTKYKPLIANNFTIKHNHYTTKYKPLIVNNLTTKVKEGY